MTEGRDKKKKPKKKNSKKILIMVIIACMPFIIIACTGIMLVSSVTVNYFGSTSVDDNLSDADNEKMLAQLKNITSSINNYNTYDGGTRIGKLSDYYGTDTRFELEWPYTLAYLKYQQFSSDKSSANSIVEVISNINKAVDALSPRFDYKKDKIVTVREYKEIEYLFDILSGTQVDSSIKIIDRKPGNFNAAGYPIGTKIYVNDEDKTYMSRGGSKNIFSDISGLPSNANNVIVYNTKPSDFSAENYTNGQIIYIYDENTTYTVKSYQGYDYSNNQYYWWYGGMYPPWEQGLPEKTYYYFDEEIGKPQELSAITIYPSKSQLQDPSEYQINDIFYIIDENKTYNVVSSAANVFNIINGKPSELLNTIILDTKGANFDRKNYKTGDSIYIINENQTYKAIEKEVTKTETKEDEKYFLVKATNIQGTYTVTYKSESQVTEKTEKETITVTKPVIDTIKQIDTPYNNFKNIMQANYPNEDAAEAVDGIVSAANNYMDQDIGDTDIFATGGGTFNGTGESFNGDSKAFIDKVVPDAEKAWQKYNILPSITIAQSILESGWGKSQLSVKANNLFGVKAFSDWTGPYVEMMTQEYDSVGASSYVMAKFRAYSSWDDSIEDHSKVLMQNNFAAVRAAKNYRDAAYALSSGGYATDPNYPTKVISYIEQYNLNQYDSEAMLKNGGN